MLPLLPVRIVFMAKKKQKKSQTGQTFLSPDQYVKQRVRSLQIGKCYVSEVIDKASMGHVVVTRQHTGGRLSVAFFLVDMACLGVKDSFYILRMEDFELDERLKDSNNTYRECSYEEAHNRIYGAIAYAEEAGIKPDKSFLLTQYFLEEDTDDIPLQEFEYGLNGKHHLVCHSNLEASRYLPLLRKNLGEGNFSYLINIGSPFGDEDYDDDDEGFYYKEDERERLKDVKTLLGFPASHFTMDDLLHKLAEGMGFFNLVLELGIEEGLTQDELRKRYIDCILKDPYNLMRRLPVQDTQILIKMYQQPGENTSLSIIYPEILTFLQMAGVADGYWYDGDFYIRLADDFREVAFPLIEKLENDKDVLSRQVLESNLDGLANLFGVLTLAEAKRQIESYSGLSSKQVSELLDGAAFDSVLMSYILRQTAKPKDLPDGILSDDQIVLLSRYAWDDNELMRQRIFAVEDNVEERLGLFHPVETITAGAGVVPIMPNKQAESFAKYLCDTLGFEDAYADEVMFNLWYRVNHAEDPDFNDDDYQKYYEDYVIDMADISNKKRERQQAMEMLESYVRHIPRWLLRGRTLAG